MSVESIEAEKGSSLSGLSIPFLALLGMGISGYLTYVKLSHKVAVCAGIGNCEIVQNSRYSEILGIPIALLGFGMYAALLALWAWGRRPDMWMASEVPWALFGLSLTGTLYSAYLTYLEIFVIRAICPWCLASAVVVTVLCALTAREILNN
jgi:uncharacterized membrane protein